MLFQKRKLSPLLGLKLVIVLLLLSSNCAFAQEEQQEPEEAVQDTEETGVPEEKSAEQQGSPAPAEPEEKEPKTGADDDSLYEVNVYECVAPKGDPSPHADQAKTRGGVITLCFKAAHEDSASVTGIFKMEYLVTGVKEKIRQDSVWRNDAIDEKTQVACPIAQVGTCVAAAKLKDEFFEDSYTLQAKGEATVKVGGGTQNVPFLYEFKTLKAPPGALKMGEIEHEFYEFPDNPPSFPMSNGIRLWLLGALLLTLLEFAFTPSKEMSSSSSDKEGKKGDAKKKKPKKE